MFPVSALKRRLGFQHFISPGVRVFFVVNKLSRELQVAAASVVCATLLLKVNLQEM